MKLYFKVLPGLMIAVMAVTFSASAMAATPDSAKQLYDGKDYRAAAEQYGTMLRLNWPKTQVGEIYDAYTECLVITGQYDLAESKIDAFLRVMPGDAAAAKLTARKERIATLRAGGSTTASVTLETARQSYDEKNFVRAAAQYDSLLAQSGAAGATGETIDALTESLAIVGKPNEAKLKIGAFLEAHPGDALAEKLGARKILMTYRCDEFTTAVLLAKEFLTKYGAQSQYRAQMQTLLIDALGKAGRHQELIDTVEQALAAAPDHPLYGELRQKQADALFDGLKQYEAALGKYEAAMAHADPESLTYENCAYRAGEVLYRLGGAARQTDPDKVEQLVERGRQHMSQFLNHAGAMKIYPANAKRRLQALRRLKQYDAMEAEAAKYLGDDNLASFAEYDAVKNYMGEFPPKNLAGQAESSTEETSAVVAVQDAYYNRDFAKAKLLAADYLSKYPAGSARRVQAQGLMAGAMIKKGGGQELVDFVEAALAAEPNHPLYAELRKAQGDALFDKLGQYAAAQAKYADAMAHASADSAVYEASCYRAGDAIFRQAAAVAGVDTARFIDLSAQAEILMKQYLNLPARASVYPETVKRRMVAQWRTKDYAAMERDAQWFLTDEGGLDGEAKAYCGIALFKAIEDLAAEGASGAQIKNLHATGKKILAECANDKNAKATRQMVEGYFYIGDYAAQKDAALKHLARAKADDAPARAEMMIYAGIALIYQKPQDAEGALKYLDGALAEYDKNPSAVEKHAVRAAYMALTVKLSKHDRAGAMVYLEKLRAMPDTAQKTKLLRASQSMMGL